MDKITQRMKAQLVMFLLLCVSMTAMADGNGVLIDGVYYNLQNSWYYYYYDANGNYQGSPYVNHAAIVTYNPDTEVGNPGSVETYTGDVQIPATVTYSGTEYSVVAVSNYAFANCRSLTSVQLPSSILQVGSYAFRYCTSLTSVSMPCVEKLDDAIFNNSALTTVFLPKSLKHIEIDTFFDSNLTSITVDADNAAYTSVDGVLYDKNITKIEAYPRKKGGTYRIPATITTIKSRSFPGGLSLDELIIPATVSKIESNAFYSDPIINKITIEDSNTELTIGQGTGTYGYSSYYDEYGNYQPIYPMFNQTEVFYWGRNLKFSSTYSSPFANSSNLKTIVFGANVTSIPEYSFYNCYSISAVDVKGGIAQWCGFDFSKDYSDPFYRRTNVTVTFNGSELSGAVVIPSEITSIPSHGFQYGCTGITDLTIPATVTSIADGAFKGLSSLNTIQLAAGNNNFIVEDNVLYNKEKTKMLCFPQLRAGDYTMPATITEMGDYQFYNCINLTGITLSNAIQTIGQYAFAGCTNLATITMSSSAKTIGQYAFANCAKLTSISIPASVENINSNAFDGCIALANLVFEDGDEPLNLARYGSYLYQEVENSYYRSCGIFRYSPIEKLYIGRNLNVPKYTGYEWSEERYLFKSEKLSRIEIGNKVNSIPAGFFFGCSNVKDVVFDGTIIDWCNITFADQYATPFGAYSGPCPILYVRVNPQPDPNVEHYPVHSQVNIPEGATKIGAYAFYGQSGVSTVIVPSTVTTIEPFAFTSATDVYINATSVIDLEDINSFGGNTNIYVLDDIATTYKNAAVWSDIKDRIFPKGFLTVTVDLVAMGESPALLPALNALERVNGEYRISALTNLKIKGTMNGWDFMMIRNKMTNLRHLDLSEAIICDNDGGVEYYTGYHTIPGTIAPYTFYGLKNLKSVTLPDGLTSIGHHAFAESGITDMVINEGIKTIESNAFSNCNNLTNLTIGKGLETIGDQAFYYCSSLRKLVFPTTLRSICSYAFYNCSALTDIDFAEGLTDIGYSAFQYCNNLKDLHLPTSLRNISEYAFNNCNNLNVVHVPSLMKQIGDYAFKNCGLKSVYAYTITPIQINQNTFDYNGVSLYAPDNSFYAYYLNTQWGQFADVLEFPALYTNWYTGRNTDITISTDTPIKSEDAAGSEGEMEPGSGLIFVGDGEQLVKKLILNWNHGDNYPSLIDNGNLNVDELAFIMNVYSGRWYFFCFPFDVKINDIKFGGNGKYVWRYYDPAARAAGGTGWKNVTDDVLKANKGYIFQCNTAGDLELPAYNPEYLSKTKGTADDKDVNLISQEAENPQDASWNFVGNPNLSYYSLDDMAEDFTSPITVWNDENQTYDAVVPGDDDYEIHPFQAFFVQKPAESEGVTFRAENRATFNQATEKAAARRLARGTRGVDENHLIVNIELSDGTSTDKTRVVFDDSKSLNYEIGADANKMMSMAEVPQVYTLDNKNVKYAVNNRPNNNNEVRLGFVAPATRTYTIKVPRMDIRMALKDHATGTIHDFSKGNYSFLAEAGTNENRFSLISYWDTTGISEAGIEGLDMTAVDGGICINGITDQPVSVYNLKGIRMATLSTSGNVNLASGTYIVTAGGKASKVVVR